jgi:hypothetical protein
MDLINKGVELIRRSTLTKRHQKHHRNLSQESDASSPPSICKTPSITSSITSDEGSCYSVGFSNIMTPSQTPGRNSASSATQIPLSFTITPAVSTPPQSPVNKKYKGKLN